MDKKSFTQKQTRVINLFLSSAEIKSDELRGSIAVVIDVLRASTSIITALAHGAKSVIPVAQVETARKLAAAFHDRPVLLCGERNEMIIEGFDLSNSPLEYTTDRVMGKTIIFTSTNGAQLFDHARTAAQVIVGAFVNVSVLSHYLVCAKADVSILCAGKNGRIGLEDVVCGGMIISQLLTQMDDAVECNDGAIAAHILYRNYANHILDMLYQASHGKRLIAIGQEQDLKICGAIDAIGTIPVLSGDELILSRNE